MEAWGCGAVHGLLVIHMNIFRDLGISGHPPNDVENHYVHLLTLALQYYFDSLLYLKGRMFTQSYTYKTTRSINHK